MLVSPLHHFFRTTSQVCPYLAGKIERKVLTELGSSDPVSLYNGLSRAGFRRSRQFAYRPACANCTACIPVRIDVAGFIESRWTRRTRRANADLLAAETHARASTEQYRLFSRYLNHRHVDSDMADMSFGDYRAMIEDSPIETRLVTLRDASGLLFGACLADRLDDGYSAVYSYYEPGEVRRSIGSHLVLSLVDLARAAGLPYIYLGYWIAESRKMTYKTRFQPLELLGPDGWTPMVAEAAADDGIGLAAD